MKVLIRITMLGMLAILAPACGALAHALAQDCSTTQSSTGSDVWQNGQWWYRLANQGWMRWNGSTWTASPSGPAAGGYAMAPRSGPVRSFSYEPPETFPANDLNPPVPAAMGPWNAQTEVVDRSFGVRSAVAKALGNYR